MKTRRTVSIAAAAVWAALLIPACYTLVSHPRVKHDAYEEVSDRRCSQCHSDTEVWSYHHPPKHFYVYDERYPAWGQYYNVPWWYNGYWYYDRDTNEPSTIPVPARGFRPDNGTGNVKTAVPTTRTKPPVSPESVEGTSNSKGNPNEESKKRTARPNRKKNGDDRQDRQ